MFKLTRMTELAITDDICEERVIPEYTSDKLRHTRGEIKATVKFDTQIALPFACVCWGLMILLITVGAVKVLMHYRHIEMGCSAVTVASFVLSIIAVLFLTAARLPYAVTVVFLLLIVKGILVFRVHSV